MGIDSVNNLPSWPESTFWVTFIGCVTLPFILLLGGIVGLFWCVLGDNCGF